MSCSQADRDHAGAKTELRRTLVAAAGGGWRLQQLVEQRPVFAGRVAGVEAALGFAALHRRHEAARVAQDAAPTAYTEWGGGASNDDDYNLEAFVAAEVTLGGQRVVGAT